MQEHFDFVDYANKVRTTSRSLMSSISKVPEISGRMHLLTLATERDLISFGDSSEASHVACGPGCGACCILNVSVLLPEAIAISWFLQRRLSALERDKLCDRLENLSRKTRWVDDEERMLMHEPCAFLNEQGRCVIHVVRPLLCRAITSTDPVVCREGIAMTALQGAPSLEMNLFQKNLIDTVYCGLADALEDLGLDHQPRRLSSAVLALIVDPGMADIFACGEKVPIN